MGKYRDWSKKPPTPKEAYEANVRRMNKARYAPTKNWRIEASKDLFAKKTTSKVTIKSNGGLNAFMGKNKELDNFLKNGKKKNSDIKLKKGIKTCKCGRIFDTKGEHTICFRCSMEQKGYVRCEKCNTRWHDPKWEVCYICHVEDGESGDDLF